jgi:squalene synthase HpnC
MDTALSTVGIGAIEAPSGKGMGDENFPVGSFLIRADLRRHVHAFYGFARTGDDIADDPKLAPDDKVERLATLGAIIEGRITGPEAERLSPQAARMRASLIETGVTPRHCLDLLSAFTRDARQTRYRDWADLLDYCFHSASPVGRHLLDLHGEGPACRDAADALCNALQIVNHLQDCGADYRALDRVYLPLDAMAAESVGVEDLALARLTPGMRGVLDRVIAPLDGLLAACADIVALVEDERIALECEIIRRLCVRLTERLKREDPLATRVTLSKPAAGAIALGALTGGWWRRRLGSQIRRAA